MTKVRKAVIPAAGYGTRMLPITKTIPKEMLPLVDKPIIQVVVEELVAAGIEYIVVVTTVQKAALSDYFGDTNPGLVTNLWTAGPHKAQILEELEAVKHLANFAFIEQHGVYGTGTPVLNAEPYIGGEPFIYTFADDFFVGEQNSFRQLIDVYDKYGSSVIAAQKRTKEEDYKRYGYVGGKEIEPGVLQVSSIIEQPGKENAPGDLASLGGFLVTPDLFPYLRQAHQALQENQELFFNEAFNLMLADGKDVFAKEITGASYYDTGNKLEYMKSAVAMGARHPEIGKEFRQFLKEFNNGQE